MQFIKFCSLVLISLTLVGLGGCAGTSTKPQMTPLEIQSLQTREYYQL